MSTSGKKGSAREAFLVAFAAFFFACSAALAWTAASWLVSVNQGTQVFSAGTIASGGTASCTMTGVTTCSMTVGAGNITVALPTGMTAGQLYWLQINSTANVTIGWAVGWKFVDQRTGTLTALTSTFSGGANGVAWIPFTLDGGGTNPLAALGWPDASGNTVTANTVAASGTVSANSVTSTVPIGLASGGTGNATGVEYAAVSVSGALGNLASTASATLLQGCTVALGTGHFTNLVIVNDLNGSTCTTAPTYNVRDDTAATTGTALTGTTTAGQATQAESLAFTAGDRICLVRTVNGGTCVTPVFTVIAQAKDS